MNIFINIFIFLANLVAILLLYYSWNKNFDKKNRALYTMIGIGVMYIGILIIYWLSSIGIDSSKVSESSRNMITFAFVPVNTIIILPFLVRSYGKVKYNEMKMSKFQKRVTIMAILILIIFISEFFYFRNVQKQILDMANQSNVANSQSANNTDNIENNSTENYNNTLTNNTEENSYTVLKDRINTNTNNNSSNTTNTTNTSNSTNSNK